MSNKVLVIGLQRSGHAAVRLLMKQGFDVTVTINNALSAEDKAILGPVKVYEGGHPLALLEVAWAFIVKNPGIPYHIPFVNEAVQRGFEIITEIELGYRFSNNLNLALTGTNGKTTTTTLVYDIIKAYYSNTYCGGNIGIPLCDIVMEHNQDNYVILELSSFQLMGTTTFKPYIASILNLAPDHLDYMSSLEAYYESKLVIYQNQDENDYFLLNEDDDLINEYVGAVKAQIVRYSLKKKSDVYLKEDWLYYFGEPIIDTNKVQIIGQHNLYNIIVAIIYAKLVKVSNECIQKIVYGFKGVEYRLERVEGFKNNVYYNDSKSTTPDSTIIALEALKDRPVLLILGGFDKKLDFTELNEKIDSSNNVIEMVTYGQIKNDFSDLNTKVSVFETLNEVVNYLEKNIDDKVVLFSPATSSYDQYDNYEVRGEDFNKLIKR